MTSRLFYVIGTEIEVAIWVCFYLTDVWIGTSVFSIELYGKESLLLASYCTSGYFNRKN